MKTLYKLLTTAAFLLAVVLPLSAQNRTISGTVSDERGEPLAGATVVAPEIGAAFFYNSKNDDGETMVGMFKLSARPLLIL